MKIRLSRFLWGLLGVVTIAAVVVMVVLWSDDRVEFPSGAIVVPRDVALLDDALALAAPGDTIVIEPSTSQIIGPIVLDVPDITLVSSGDRVSVEGSGGNPTISILAEGVTLRGFDITSESIGLRVDATDCLIEDIVVDSAPIGIQLNDASRCVIRLVETRRGEIGIELIDSGSVLLEESTVSGASEFGVRLLGSWNSTLKNLDLSENAVGISLEQASTDNMIEASHIEFSSIAGIEVRASNDNTVLETTLASVRIGIVLEGVTGTEILSCELNATTVSGILVQQSLQNRIVETHIEASQGTGIQLTQSSENALLRNGISNCGDAGISLISSGRNLIMENVMDRCSFGLALSRSDDNRILRNKTSGSSSSGFILSQGESNRLLDNVSVDGAYGITVVESGGNTILRNRLSGAEGGGLLLSHTSGGNHVAENEIHKNVRGLVLLAVTRDLFTQNEILSNDTGVWLSSLGPNVRIEGNSIAENQIGLKHSTSIAEAESHLVALGIPAPSSSQNMVPVLANNVFRENAKLDIQNDTLVPLPAADNWWGRSSSRDAAVAVVSDGVLLEQSAWKGVIAVGTGSTDVRVLLGRILQLSLLEAGFRVIDLVGMGPSERVRQALSESDVDLIWWSSTKPDSQFPIDESATIVVATSAMEGWSIIVSSRLASQLSAPTASGLSAWFAETGEPLRFASMVSLERSEFDAFTAAYGLTEAERSFTQAESLEEVEALLKFGAVDVVLVGNLEETLTIAGFLEISDDLSILDRAKISMILQQSMISGNPGIDDILNALGEKLTGEVLHDLVSRIRLLHQDPKDVAREFVQQ